MTDRKKNIGGGEKIDVREDGKRTVAGWAETRDGAHLVRRASSSLVHPPRILKHFAFGETARRATKSKSSGRKSAGWSPAASKSNDGGRLPNALRGRRNLFVKNYRRLALAEGNESTDAPRRARARERRVAVEDAPGFGGVVVDTFKVDEGDVVEGELVRSGRLRLEGLGVGVARQW